MNPTTNGSGFQDLAQFYRQELNLDQVRTIDALPRDASSMRRASFNDRRAVPAPEEIATLVWDGTRLRWDFGRELAPASPFSTPARRAWWWNKAPAKAAPQGEVVQQLVFEQLEKAQVGAALTALDQRLTPQAFQGTDGARGLRRFRNGAFEPFDPAALAKAKKVLVFIHGTFSNSESLLTDGLMTIDAGKALLAQAEKSYDLVLAFDHPTLSVSPSLNALDLAYGLRSIAATKFDIVCHSRGGLVARWFCEFFCPPSVQRRAVLVGSPLAGTSLASAPRIRDFFDFLTNVGNALRTTAQLASAAAPWLTAVVGLMRLGTALTGGLANLPIADGLIALVPGLQSQARVGNNEEILRLQRAVPTWNTPQSALRYFAITSDFEPSGVGWNFLEYFRQIPTRVLDGAADRLFKEANDLVVDTASMTSLADKVPIADSYPFGPSPTVHHCNYFIQTETVKHIREWLEIV